MRRLIDWVAKAMEPPKVSRHQPELILLNRGWFPEEIETTAGRWACLGIEIDKLKRDVWEAIFKEETQ